MKNRVFLDTSFSIALAIAKDEFHTKANQLAEQLTDAKSQIFTTGAVILEIGNALSRRKYRQSATGIIRRLQSEQNTSIVAVTDELFDEAFDLFQNRPDKNWSIVDCISFVVMQERGIVCALTTDEHFVQAGFRALLRED